jgi:hypothetical protein
MVQSVYCTKIFLDLNAADVETLDAEKLIAWKIRQGLAEDVEIPEALLQYSGLEEEITFAQESPCCAIYFNVLPPNTEVRPSPSLPSHPLPRLPKKGGDLLPPLPPSLHFLHLSWERGPPWQQRDTREGDNECQHFLPLTNVPAIVHLP